MEGRGRQGRGDTTPVTPTPSATPYKIASYNNYRINKGDLAAAIDTANGNRTKPGYIISDVRTPNEYAGYYVDSTTTRTTGLLLTLTAILFPRVLKFLLCIIRAGVRGIFRMLNSAFTQMIFIRTISTQAASQYPATLQKEHNVQVLKSEADLRAHFEGLGITPDKISLQLLRRRIPLRRVYPRASGAWLS